MGSLRWPSRLAAGWHAAHPLAVEVETLGRSEVGDTEGPSGGGGRVAFQAGHGDGAGTAKVLTRCVSKKEADGEERKPAHGAAGAGT